MCDKVVGDKVVCERDVCEKVVCERVVCVCQRLCVTKIVCDKVVRDKIVCDKVVFERDGLTCSLDVTKCHACQAKRRSMSPSATPATQTVGGCRQVPHLPRKV